MRSTYEPREARVATTTRSSPALAVIVRSPVQPVTLRVAPGTARSPSRSPTRNVLALSPPVSSACSKMPDEVLDEAGREAGARRPGGDAADDQQVVAEEEVAVELLDQGVVATCVEEHVASVAAGDRVVAAAAVDDVVVAAADQGVVAVAGAAGLGVPAVVAVVAHEDQAHDVGVDGRCVESSPPPMPTTASRSPSPRMPWSDRHV